MGAYSTVEEADDEAVGADEVEEVEGAVDDEADEVRLPPTARHRLRPLPPLPRFLQIIRGSTLFQNFPLPPSIGCTLVLSTKRQKPLDYRYRTRNWFR